MEIDSTPLDVMVALDGHASGRVELVGLIDVATMTVPAAVMVPTTKAIDAALLLAQAVTPELMRPGWVQALRMSRSVLPYERLLTLDERLAHSAARPLILPENITCDRHMVFRSQNFRDACRHWGISIQPGRPRTGPDKPHIERSFESVGTLFSQFLRGYTGRSAEHRGLNVSDEPLWNLHELQEIFDEWVVAKWQNRPHSGLRDPANPGKPLTPNEKYAVLIESAGYIPMAVSQEEYVGLLPKTWRTIQARGVQVDNRVYDDDNDAIRDLRGRPSGITAQKNLWEVRYNPYEPSHIYVRDHWNDRWITLYWKHLRANPAPFAGMTSDLTRKVLARRGSDPATEQQIAEAADALLQRAHTGPPSPAAAQQPETARAEGEAELLAVDSPTPSMRDPHGAQSEAEPEQNDIEEHIAKVIPMPIFDPREHSKRRW